MVDDLHIHCNIWERHKMICQLLRSIHFDTCTTCRTSSICMKKEESNNLFKITTVANYITNSTTVQVRSIQISLKRHHTRTPKSINLTILMLMLIMALQKYQNHRSRNWRHPRIDTHWFAMNYKTK